MARKRIKNADKERLTPLRGEPNSIQFGRSYEVRRRALQLSLFDIVGFLPEEEKGQFRITIGEKEERELGVTLLSIKRVDFALREVLYIQSYQNRNKDYTGLAKNGILTDGAAVPPENIDGKEYNASEIHVKLGELAQRAFGENTFTSRKLTELTLKALQTGITVTNSAGDEKRRALIWIKGHDYDSKTKAKVLIIVLTGLYAKDIENNYALHENGVLKKLGKLTEAKFELLSLLGLQRKDKPYTISLPILLDKLSLTEDYKKNKKRVLKTLQDSFLALIDTGIITQLPKADKTPKGDIQKYTFLLNPDYGKGK